MPNIAKTGGAISYGVAGAQMVAPQVAFDPEAWLETFSRALKKYVYQYFYHRLYEVIESFPASDALAKRMPFAKTIIHFNFDDFENRVMGFGSQVFTQLYDDTHYTVTDMEVQQHIVDIDFGIWAVDQTGGVTARLKAMRKITDLFHGPNAQERMRNIVGVEIVSFQGGNFIDDEINDLPVYRVGGITLRARVFSRKVLDPVGYITDFVPFSGLLIDDQVLIDN